MPRTPRHVANVPTCDIERTLNAKKAARRRQELALRDGQCCRGLNATASGSSVAWTTDSQTLCLLVLHYVQKQTTYRPDENATVSTRGDVVRPTHDANIWRASKNCETKQRAGDGRGPCDKSQNKPPHISSKAERHPKRRSLGDRGGHHREQGLFRVNRVGLSVYPALTDIVVHRRHVSRCQQATSA
jgi:hypothetical protein